MIPAKFRGRVDLAVNGTYWAGAILGTVVTLWLPQSRRPGVGLALAFLAGRSSPSSSSMSG